MTAASLLVWVCMSLLHAHTHARQLRASLPGPIAVPDYRIYHYKKDLLEEVSKIVAAHPDIMSMEVMTGGDQAYNISMQVVHVEVGGITANHDKKARLFLDFGEHPREMISSELGLSLLQHLTNPAAIKALVGGGERGDKLMALLSQVVFKILPMENEAGRDLVELGKACERKNGRGVDPNRNWEVDWGRKEKDYDPNEEYPGTKPFSEPEARIVLDIARGFKPHVWLNVHSGMEAMFTPWDHRAQVATGAEEALQILQTIKDNLFTESCVVGSGGKSVGYLAHGTATDYMFERLKIPMPYTWEIYGDMNAPFNDCFRMFNPLTKQHVQSVIELWLKAIFRLIELMPGHPALVSEELLQPGSIPAPRQQQQEPDSSSIGQGEARAPGSETGSSQGSTDTGSTLIQPRDGQDGSTETDASASLRRQQADGSVLLVTPLQHIQHGVTRLAVGLTGVVMVGWLAFRCVRLSPGGLCLPLAKASRRYSGAGSINPTSIVIHPVSGLTRLSH